MDAKYPALLFKQQLTAFVEKIYGLLRDNVKKEITPQLGSCIQAPRAARAAGGGASRSAVGRSASNSAAAAPTLSNHWRVILDVLEKLLETFKAMYVPQFLMQKFFTQARQPLRNAFSHPCLPQPLPLCSAIGPIASQAAPAPACLHHAWAQHFVVISARGQQRVQQ